MLDRQGYRPNVGIILVNGRNEVFWGKRIREHAWQFPSYEEKRTRFARASDKNATERIKELVNNLQLAGAQ